MITIVMPPQSSGAETLTLQTSPTVPSGEVTLRAVATLTRVPGREVSRWSVDGASAGTGTWTRVRRNQDGTEVWQTSVQVTLADGDHIVTVSFRGMTDGASITAVPMGGGAGPTEIQLRIAGFARTDWLPGINPGAQGANAETLSVAGAGIKYILMAINYKVFNNSFYATPSWYVSSTASPTTAQFGSIFVGSSIIFRLDDCPAGEYEVYATLNIQGVTAPTNTVTLTVT